MKTSNIMTVLAVAPLLLSLISCAAEQRRDDLDTDTDTDAGADADVDTDGDGDVDTDDASDGGAQEGSDCQVNIDVVFVIDVSTTMSNYMSTLRNQIGNVWEAVAELDDDPHFGLVVFVDDVLVVSAESYSQASDLQSDFQTWYTHTSSNQQTGSTAWNLDYPENSLDALYAAATEYDWRAQDDTLRLIIHATDDTFREYPDTFSEGIQAERTYGEVVQVLQEKTIRVASFASHVGGASGHDNVEAGFFDQYDGQTAIPEATSGQVFDVYAVGISVSLEDAIGDFIIEEYCSDYEIE